MSSLLNAIKTKWYGESSLTSLVTGGLYLSQVPEKLGNVRIDLPYGIAEVGRTRYLWTLSTRSYEVTDVHFDIFVAGSAANLETILDTIHSVFDWGHLTFSNSATDHLTYFQPLDEVITCEPVKYRDGSMVYRGTLRYETFVSKHRVISDLPLGTSLPSPS